MGEEAALTAEERALLLAYARRAVESAVRNGSPDPDPPTDDPFARPGAAFVTLKRRESGALRGCIGRLVAALPGLRDLDRHLQVHASLRRARDDDVRQGDLEIDLLVERGRLPLGRLLLLVFRRVAPPASCCKQEQEGCRHDRHGSHGVPPEALPERQPRCRKTARPGSG